MMLQYEYIVQYRVTSIRSAKVTAESFSDAVGKVSESIGPHGDGKGLGAWLRWDAGSLQIDESDCTVLHPAAWKPIDPSDETLRDLARLDNNNQP